MCRIGYSYGLGIDRPHMHYPNKINSIKTQITAHKCSLITPHTPDTLTLLHFSV